jgi:hypothetical protein
MEVISLDGSECELDEEDILSVKLAFKISKRKKFNKKSKQNSFPNGEK